LIEGIKFEEDLSFGRLYQLTATIKPDGKAAVVLEAPQRLTRSVFFSSRGAAFVDRLTCSRLSVIALSDAADGKIFIEIRPMQAKRRQLDFVQLGGRRASEARIFRRSEPQFGATL